MIIDFHTHTFPDQIAASAIARLSNNAHMSCALLEYSLACDFSTS